MAYIELVDVSFSWPEGGAVLQSVALSIRQNQTLALYGANGSGKTTLSKLMVGLLRPSAGAVFLSDRPLPSYSLGAVGKKIGYVFQNPEKQFFAPTVAEEIGFALAYRGFSPQAVEERVAEMLADFELEPYKTAVPLKLSRGEKQRLALAAVMAPKPEFIIMDEPFSGLDYQRLRQLQAVLRRLAAAGVGYMIISHDRDLCAVLCESELTLTEGRLQ